MAGQTQSTGLPVDPEVAAILVGGALGATLGSALAGRRGMAVGALAGGFLGDAVARRIVDQPQVQGTPKSPTRALEQCKQQCEALKGQMVAALETIPDPVQRTAYQMAINAVNYCVGECHTATGAL